MVMFYTQYIMQNLHNFAIHDFLTYPYQLMLWNILPE